MKFISYILLASILLLSACTAPTEEELSDAISKKLDEQVDKAIGKVTDEATQKANELIENGTTEAENILNNILGEIESPTESAVQTGGTTEQIPVELKRVYDGDTIVIIYEGQEVDLRYLLVDSSELKGEQPFSQEAKARNKELVESGQLTIEFDVGERFDKYGRLLGYLYVDGVSVQETLLTEGLVRIAYVIPPNTRYLTEFEAASEKAKKAKIGVWSIEGYATENGYND